MMLHKLAAVIPVSEPIGKDNSQEGRAGLTQ